MTRLLLSAASFLLVSLALVLNYFREPLLGLKEGYAPHNFYFNFTFFLPSMALAFVLSLYVAIMWWKSKAAGIEDKYRWISFVLFMPALLFWAFILVMIVWIIVETLLDS